jgi:hypothetical protein
VVAYLCGNGHANRKLDRQLVTNAACPDPLQAWTRVTSVADHARERGKDAEP